MKYTIAWSLGVFAYFAIGGAALGETRLDRPTPPPQCVDGVCTANPASYGYFKTRWRAWPGLGVAPMPSAEPQPTPSLPGVPPYEVPPPEKEDLKAPPPTKSAQPVTTGTTPPAGAAPGVLGPGGPTPPTGTEPFGPRETGAGPSAPPFPLPPAGTQPGPFQPSTPFQPQSGPFSPAGPPTPLQRPTTAPLGEGPPTSDLDLPPAPRFAALQSAATANAASPVKSPPVERFVGPVMAPATGIARHAVDTQLVHAMPRNDRDPPPPPPLSLGGASL